MESVSESRFLERASHLLTARRYDDAIKLLHQALLTYPESGSIHAILSLCYRDIEKLPEATRHAEQSIVSSPDNPMCFYSLGHVLFARNQFEAADKAVDEAIRLDSNNADVFSLKAQIQFASRNWRKALESADRGLEIEPDHEVCANLRGMSLRQLRQGGTAEEMIRASLARDPQNPLTHANLGWTLLEQGKTKEALKHFQEALRLEPDSAYARQGLVHALRAHFFVYRILFGYFAWIAKFDQRIMWGIIIGGYFGYQALNRLAANVPALAPWIMPITVAYIVFALSTWLMTPLINILLLSNRYGRYALPTGEKATAVVVACLLLFGLIAFLIGHFELGSVHLIFVGAMLGMLAIPVSTVGNCQAGWPRWTALGIVGGMGLMVAILLGSVIVATVNGTAKPPAASMNRQMFLLEIEKISKLSEGEREQRERELAAQFAADIERQELWNKKMLKGWETSLFSIYCTVFLLSQFAVMGLQTARVRL
jgi:tetratricopeptide (TPR) repeat protein